ncbi:ComF family protein [Anaerotignum sp.]|nr:ComF family protein [Anaerotignum sp.]MBQ7757471.1 ComF family protein [Anaerotignum sp.]
MKEKLIALLFPPRCAVCGEVLALDERDGFLCKTCSSHIPYIPKKICPHCGGETDRAGFCEFCLKTFAFETACAAFPYEKVRKSIHLFKYEGGKKLGYGLGELMADYLLKYHEELLVWTDLILSVPLHPKKEKHRGFNQTHILCEKISEKTDLVFQKDGLRRKRNTAAQSTLNSPEERRQNLKDAFEATADFAGKRILLVDDIFTTGSTCNECARTLYRAGAKEVHVFCLSAAGLHMEQE